MMVLVTICAGRSVKHNSEQATLTQKRAYFLANLLSKAAGQSEICSLSTEFHRSMMYYQKQSDE
jgi:hypothetical protein